MDLKKHVVQHPCSANEDTKAQNGEWFNFLKVKPYGMGAGGERMGCLFYSTSRMEVRECGSILPGPL